MFFKQLFECAEMQERIKLLETAMAAADKLVMHAYADCECVKGPFSTIRCEACTDVHQYDRARAAVGGL